MNTSTTKPDNAATALRTPTLCVHVPAPDQVAAFDQQLAAQHYLGAGRPVGDYLRQIVERDGRPVALLVWGPACYALKDRDLWISWSVNQRVERLKLIVQNRRFLLLTPKGAAPNCHFAGSNQPQSCGFKPATHSVASVLPNEHVDFQHPLL